MPLRPPSKQLLVNADDFGLTEGITDGIIEAHQRGIVTSTSIVASGAAFQHAVRQAHSNESLGIGVHLTLVEELPVSDPKDIPTLVRANGKLPRNYTELLSGLVFGRIRSEHVERELRAQVMKCLKFGLRPTHLDSHQHVHTLPAILRIAIRLGEEFDIPGIRLPRDSPRRHIASLQRSILCMLARWDARYLRGRPFCICDRMTGLFQSGALGETALMGIVRRLPEGSTELVCHPGKADRGGNGSYAHWRYHWEIELNALTSERVRDMLRAQDIQLITYKDLQRSTKNLPSPISSAGPVR